MSQISLLKHGFFNPSHKKSDAFSFTRDDFDLNQLKSEFSLLYQIIHSNKKSLQKNSEIVLYFNRISELSIQYFQCDYVADDLKNYLNKKQEIDQFFLNIPVLEQQTTPSNFGTFLVEEIQSTIINFITGFKSSAKVRRYFSSLISNRSYWNYSRWLAKNLILCILQSPVADFFRKMNECLGCNTSPETILQILELPQDILRFLSFFLYIVRILINLIMIAKHLILAAFSKELSLTKVLIQEIEKRAYILASDLSWCIVNLLSNYNQFFGISSPIIGQLNTFFLAFDIILFLAIFSYEKRVYNHQVSELVRQRSQAKSVFEISLINRQIDLLNDEWKAQYDYYLFNIAAAVILAVAFGLTFACTSPYLLVGLIALNMLGNACYNSCEEYKKYRLAAIAVKREQLNGQLAPDNHHKVLLEQLNQECIEARNYFWRTLAFNVGFTALIICTSTISWPIAVAITILYLSYKIYESYEKKQQTSEKKMTIDRDIYRLFSPKVETAADKDVCTSIYGLI